MKSPRLLLTILILLSHGLFAQFTGHYNALNITGSQNTLKSEIPLAKPLVTGSAYLDDNWQHAQIVLKNGYIIDDFPIKIEIEQGLVEFRYNDEVKYISLREVDFISLADKRTGRKEIIKSAHQFAFGNVPLKGIVKIHGGQRYSAVKQFYVEFLPSNYNIAMDVGSKDHRKVKKEKFYISQSGKLILVKGSAKKIAAQLGDDREKALKLIKEHKFNLSKEPALIAFVELMQP